MDSVRFHTGKKVNQTKIYQQKSKNFHSLVGHKSCVFLWEETGKFVSFLGYDTLFKMDQQNLHPPNNCGIHLGHITSEDQAKWHLHHPVSRTVCCFALGWLQRRLEHTWSTNYDHNNALITTIMRRICIAEAMGGVLPRWMCNAHRIWVASRSDTTSSAGSRYGRFGEHLSVIAALTLAQINHTCAQRLIGLTLAVRLRSAVAGGGATGWTKSCQVR